MLNTPELLAPAGSMEALVAGLNSGADAVYLGGKLFSARAYAANFDDREIQEAVNLTHRRGKKVYVTVNTLLDNGELEQVANYLHFLYRVGADAVIVQDLGLLNLARQVLPQLELHASTQMTIYNSAGARFMAEQGVQRVVLARELSLEDIRAIHRESQVELEAFVHGALCVCYSGQCLMSSLIGGRSGNRGRCAQPCRLPYTLVERETEKILGESGLHLLSTKDLCLVERLPELVRAGIRSFKFEGRMKRPEYVATVIRVYRQALDRCLEDPEHYFVTDQERKDLYQIFNRDFTTGYFFGNPAGDLMSYKRPNNRGLHLGRLVSVDPARQWGRIKLDETLRSGDGIEVWVTRGGRKGTTVRQILVDGRPVEEAAAGALAEINLPEGARSGDRVFKTHDVRLMALAQEATTFPRDEDKTPVKALVRVSPGEPLRITLIDPAGNRGEAETGFLAEPAVRRPLTPETLRQQLDRMGNTPFTLGELETHINGELMVPLSEINSARRQAVEALVEQQGRAAGRPHVSAQEFSARVRQALAPLTPPPRQATSRPKPLLSVVVGDLASVMAATAAGADRIYLGGDHLRGKGFSTRELERSVELCGEKGVQVILATPRIWHEGQRDEVQRVLRTAVRLQAYGLMVANPGSLQSAREMAQEIRLFGDYPLNPFNDLAVDLLHQEGMAGVTLSPELNLKQIEQLAGRRRYDLECVVHGSLPLMVSEYCTLGAALGDRTSEAKCNRVCMKGRYGLLDRMRFVFPIETDVYCRMYIYNPKELCLVEHLPEFTSMGIASLRIEAGKEPDKYVAGVVHIYREALDRTWDGQATKEYLERERERLAHFSPGGFTKGHYFRGVL